MSEGAHASSAPAPPATLLLVGPLPPPPGGMANQTQQLARLLEHEGCSVTVVRTNDAYRPAWIASLPGVRALFRLVPYLIRLWRAASSAIVMHVMANSGWAWHLLAAPAIWIGALRGVPVIVNYRGGEAASFLDRQLRWVRPTLARATHICVPSGFLRDVFARHGIETCIVPNIVDVAAFRPASDGPRAPHVVVTRALEPIYDIGTALRAFALIASRHPEARLTVAGSGPERARLLELAATLGIVDRVTFAGRIDNADLPALYQSATVALNPSLADNMPISLLEALASGVPIVSTRVGGVPYLVSDEETALLVPPADPPAMAAAMLRLIDEPPVARRLAANGSAIVEQFTWPRVRDQLLAVYARAQASPRP